MSNDVKNMKMSEIFTEDQIERVIDFLGAKDAFGLKYYLRSIKTDLEEKGVLPDYMFFVLCNKFNLTP